jgi:hypothetical protein
MHISIAEIRKICNRLRINLDKIDLKQLVKGVEIEYKRNKKAFNYSIETAVKTALDKIKSDVSCYQ